MGRFFSRFPGHGLELDARNRRLSKLGPFPARGSGRMLAMQYRIVATLGPACAEPADWQALLDAGASEFRLNTSHLDLPALEAWLDRLSPFLAARGRALTLDLQGSKWRLGDFPAFSPAAGDLLALEPGRSAPPGRLPVPHADFFRAALPGGEVALNDGRVRLRIETVQPERVEARVMRPGPLSSRKGITLPGGAFRIEDWSEKDRAVVRMATGREGLRCAVSYVRDAVEMARYRALAGSGAALTAKLERESALAEAGEIAALCGEVWLCRGDLGAEMGPAGMAAGAHAFAAQVAELPVPALLAGQVLEHMTAAPTPTRAEVCGLYDALQAGYAGVVLSDETAVGTHPAEAVRAAALFQDAP